MERFLLVSSGTSPLVPTHLALPSGTVHKLASTSTSWPLRCCTRWWKRPAWEADSATSPVYDLEQSLVLSESEAPHLRNKGLGLDGFQRPLPASRASNSASSSSPVCFPVSLTTVNCQILQPTAFRRGRNDSSRDQDKPNPPHRLPRLWTARPGPRKGALCPGKCLSSAWEETLPHPGWSPQNLRALPDSPAEGSEHGRIHAARDLSVPTEDGRGS